MRRGWILIPLALVAALIWWPTDGPEPGFDVGDENARQATEEQGAQLHGIGRVPERPEGTDLRQGIRTVRGTVEDTSGTLLEGIEVVLERTRDRAFLEERAEAWLLGYASRFGARDTVIATTRTDAGGRFAFTGVDLADGEHTVIARAMPPRFDARAHLYPPGRDHDVRLVLGEGTPVRMRVLGPGGQGVAGFVSGFSQREGDAFVPCSFRDVPTDEAGEVTVHLRDGSYLVHARAPGLGARSGILLETPQSRVVELTLGEHGGGTVAGTVQDEQGRGLAGARVVVRSGSSPYGLATRIVTTDAQGRFRCTALVTGMLESVAAIADGYVTVTNGITERELLPGATAEVTIRMTRGGRVEGRVTGPDGGAVAGARVQVSVEHAREGLESQVRGITDADGRYVLSPVAHGEGTVEVTAPGLYQPTTSRGWYVLGSDDPRAVVDIRLAAGRAVRGRVVDTSGQPVAGAEVRIRSWSRVEGRVYEAPEMTTQRSERRRRVRVSRTPARAALAADRARRGPALRGDPRRYAAGRRDEGADRARAASRGPGLGSGHGSRGHHGGAVPHQRIDEHGADGHRARAGRRRVHRARPVARHVAGEGDQLAGARGECDPHGRARLGTARGGRGARAHARRPDLRRRGGHGWRAGSVPPDAPRHQHPEPREVDAGHDERTRTLHDPRRARDRLRLHLPDRGSTHPRHREARGRGRPHRARAAGGGADLGPGAPARRHAREQRDGPGHGDGAFHRARPRVPARHGDPDRRGFLRPRVHAARARQHLHGGGPRRVRRQRPDREHPADRAARDPARRRSRVPAGQGPRDRRQGRRSGRRARGRHPDQPCPGRWRCVAYAQVHGEPAGRLLPLQLAGPGRTRAGDPPPARALDRPDGAAHRGRRPGGEDHVGSRWRDPGHRARRGWRPPPERRRAVVGHGAHHRARADRRRGAVRTRADPAWRRGQRAGARPGGRRGTAASDDRLARCGPARRIWRSAWSPAPCCAAGWSSRARRLPPSCTSTPRPSTRCPRSPRWRGPPMAVRSPSAPSRPGRTGSRCR